MSITDVTAADGDLLYIRHLIDRLAAAKLNLAAFAGLQLTEAEQDAFTEALAASGAIPPAVVDAAPLAPTAGLSDWSLEQLQQHARKWCDLPTVQPGPIPTPDDHPDHQLAKGES